jgi:retron-type reverse transcriptase
LFAAPPVGLRPFYVAANTAICDDTGRIPLIVRGKLFRQTGPALFRDDSHGYRPGKSALAAISVTRRRCWDYDWVVEFDIRGLFDNLDHGLLMKALRKHCQEPWILLYVERWLKAPMQTTDGQILERDKGTPQGGVVTP